MRRLRAASLIEAVVAVALFMIVFAVALELLPALTVGRGDGLDAVRMRNALESARGRYATGGWPEGEYSLRSDDAVTEAVIVRYRDFDDVAVLTITVTTDRTTTVYTQLIECSR